MKKLLTDGVAEKTVAKYTKKLLTIDDLVENTKVGYRVAKNIAKEFTEDAVPTGVYNRFDEVARLGGSEFDYKQSNDMTLRSLENRYTDAVFREATARLNLVKDHKNQELREKYQNSIRETTSVISQIIEYLSSKPTPKP